MELVIPSAMLLIEPEKMVYLRAKYDWSQSQGWKNYFSTEAYDFVHPAKLNTAELRDFVKRAYIEKMNTLKKL